MVQNNKKAVIKKLAASVEKKRKAVIATTTRKTSARRTPAVKKPSSKLSQVDQIALAKLVDNPRAPTAAMLKAYARYQDLLA